MEIDYDYLRTGTAIGFRASREFFSNYLLETVLDCEVIQRGYFEVYHVRARPCGYFVSSQPCFWSL